MSVSKARTQVTLIEPWFMQVFLSSAHGNTNWSTVNVDSSEMFGYDLESSGAQNDEIYWDIGLSAGTWDLKLLHYTGTNRGIYTVSLDGSSLGTIDGYAGSGVRNTITAITGFSVTVGKHRLKLKMATKNASSSNYYGTATMITLLRTA